MNPFTTIPAFLAIRKRLLDVLEYKVPINRAKERGDHEEARRLTAEVSEKFVDSTSKRLKITYDVSGRENIPAKGPVLVVANHQGSGDVLALLEAFKGFPLGLIGKAEFQKLYFIREAALVVSSVFIVRGNAREALKTLREAEDRFANGYSLILFPEGTRSRCGKMGHFKQGSIKFVQKQGVPIIPVTIDGSYHLLEEYGTIKPAHIKVQIHPQVETAGADNKELHRILNEVEDTIRSGLATQEVYEPHVDENGEPISKSFLK